jgi:hypothetical protein
LISGGHRELEVRYADDDLRPVAQELLVAIIRYVELGHEIREGDKMGWATSVIRFDRHGELLVLSCLSLETDAFSPDLDSLLIDWMKQRSLCTAAGSAYRNTQLSDLIVVSPGLLSNGLVREGIRYPARDPHCGWWLYGTDHRGDVSLMRNIHVGHLLTVRPELRKYLALDFGYCFSEEPEERVWFEAGVAQEPIV